MSFPSQCIIHVFKLHAFHKKRVYFDMFPARRVRSDGIHCINQPSVFSCVDQHQSQLSQDLASQTISGATTAGCWELTCQTAFCSHLAELGRDLEKSKLENETKLENVGDWRPHSNWKVLRCCGEFPHHQQRIEGVSPKTSRSAIPPFLYGKKTPKRWKVVGHVGAAQQHFSMKFYLDDLGTNEKSVNVIRVGPVGLLV